MGAQLIGTASVAEADNPVGPRDPRRAPAPRTRSRAVAVADPSTLARRALVNWCRRHAKGGDAAVAGGRRLIRPGEASPLTRLQQLSLAEALRDRYPEEYGLPGRLWSRQALAELIHEQYGVRLTGRGVNRQLRAWGLDRRTPSERACGLCVASVVSWLSHAYPEIVRRARAGGAQVCWAGRARLVGLTPAAEVTAAITTRGSVRFAVTSGRADAPLPAAFLTRLVAHEGRPVHVIMDGSFTAADWPRRPPPGAVLHSMPCCARTTGL